jgi:hypothetical protein
MPFANSKEHLGHERRRNVQNGPEEVGWGDSINGEKFGVKFIFGLSTRSAGLRLPLYVERPWLQRDGVKVRSR